MSVVSVWHLIFFRAVKPTGVFRVLTLVFPTVCTSFIRRCISTNPVICIYITHIFNILPGISRRFASSGFHGSERRQSDQRAQEEFLKELVSSRSELGFRARNQDREALLQGIGLSSQVSSAPMEELFRLLQAGEVPRQADLDRLAAQDRRVAQILNFLGVPTNENVVITEESEGIGGLLTGIANLGAAAKPGGF